MAEGVKRKISAILSADVEGYTRLMEDDEERTVQMMESYRKTVISLIEQHNGRTIDSPGDNILSEFGSVVDAVQCAVEVQHVLRAKNAGLPVARRMQFRIGINLGDVIEEEDRTYGNGVNIASRIEKLADAGGVCISESAYQQIKSRLSFVYEDLGKQSIKNIAEPVRVYRIPIGIAESGRRKWLSVSLALVGLLIIAIAFIAIPRYISESPIQKAAEPETAPIQKASPAIAEKPTIAILAFDNMSGDPEQEYFSDGVAEGIITQLSRSPAIHVIARNSSFTYKGKPVKVQQIGEELGARYVVEGSVQKAGDRIRITAQLLDAATGNHIWAEKYDRELKDVFALQDDIVARVAGAVSSERVRADMARVRHSPTDDFTAYDSFMRGMGFLLAGPTTKESIAKGKESFTRAIELDPNYSSAYAALGNI